MVAAACGDTAPATSAAPSAAPGAASPESAVAEWLRAVAGGDADSLERVVAADSFALALSLENALSVAQTAELARSGVPEATAAAYWETFASDFAGFADAAIDELVVAAVEPFAIDGRNFADVAVEFPGRAGSAFVVAAQRNDGSWQVDVLATQVAALLPRLRALVTDPAAGEDADAVTELLLDLVPSLRAASERPEGGPTPEQRREIEAVLRFLVPPLSSD